MTYKPERRSGLIKTLGPLTLMINLAAENRYTDKLENALRDSLKLFPMVNNIIECLKRMKSPTEGNQLYKAVGLALAVYGSRTHNKIHFPLLFFVRSYLVSPAEALKINFSGKDGFKFYCSASVSFDWKKRSAAVAEDIAQVVFHSMFGTALENLGVLGQITTRPVWKTRRELNDVFVKAGTQASKNFTPIAFLYISRLACANMVSNIGTMQPQMCNKMVFAGKRKRHVSEDLFSYLEKGTTTAVYSNDPASLAYQITNFKDIGVKRLREGDLKDGGTTKWCKVEGCELIDVDFIVNENGSYFYT